MKRRADRILQMVKDKEKEENNVPDDTEIVPRRSSIENLVETISHTSQLVKRARSDITDDSEDKTLYDENISLRLHIENDSIIDTTQLTKITRCDIDEMDVNTVHNKENVPLKTNIDNIEESNANMTQSIKLSSSVDGNLEEAKDDDNNKNSTNPEVELTPKERIISRRSKSRSSSTSSSSSSSSTSTTSSSSSSRSSISSTPSTSNPQSASTTSASKPQSPSILDNTKQQSTCTPSTSKPLSTSAPSTSRQHLTARPNYQISPINSGESDVDLSDFDPTYELNTNKNRVDSSSDSSSPDFTSNSNRDEANVPKKKTRKRLRNPSNWKQNIIKQLRNSGKAYTSLSKTKKRIPARYVKEPCDCRLKCTEKISENNKKELFNEYWNLNNLELQRNYIRSCMMEVKPKYKYTNAEKPRMPNNALFFTVNGNKIRVCKKFFINTLDITDRQLRTVKNKTNSLGFLEQEKRGKHNNRKQVDSSLIQDIKDHINSIPKIESHYLRANTDKEYISDSKTIKDLCDDFNKQQKENNRPECNYWLYINIFNKEFNIGFYQPKKDRCETCLSYELAPMARKIELKTNYEKHLIEKDLCRQEKKTDRKNIDTTHICAIFDLQSVMLCPSPSYYYYSSKINCLDFTITELNATETEDNKAYGDVFCYFWDETQGNRGANEIGSCLFDYLEHLSSKHPNQQLDVTFYSDNCTGQNKNKMIASLYSFAVQYFPNIQSITHKYLIKGHTQSEADNVHSLIEKEIKKNEKAGPIYTPCQYATVIKSARKTGQPFTVKELNYDFFLNLKQLQEQWAYNFNEDSEKKTVLWNDIKILKFPKDEPFVFYYKTSYLQSEFGKINMRNKRKKMLSAEEITMEKLYTQPLELKENKKRDLKDLVRKNLIPSYYASYYNSL